MAASSDTSGLIIAGIIGGGAAIITQIIASWVTGKRENKRFDWEREQQDRTWERQERERFIDLKRELYCNFSFEVSKLMASIHMLTTHHPHLAVVRQGRPKGDTSAPVEHRHDRAQGAGRVDWRVSHCSLSGSANRRLGRGRPGS
jgi:hypothetical protein